MKHTINDLWHGNIRPCEDTDRLRVERELKVFIDNHREFMDRLDDKGRKDLAELIDALDKAWSDVCDDAFKQGFSLATKLMAEAMR